MIMTIDGKAAIVKKDETILQAAKRLGIKIPTRCHKAWAEPYGSCRLCSVEITKKSWNGWSKVVTSCNYPVEDGLIVHTHSKRILRTRKVLVDLLLARCPQTKAIQELATEYGIEETSYAPREKYDDCILCGACIRACEVVGANAISMVGRGIEKKVDTPFGKPNDSCIGCASCAEVCPTQHIQYKTTGDTRFIWRRRFKMVQCSECGRAHITEAQVEHCLKNTDLTRDYFDKCEICHRKETAQTFHKLRT